jgi:hypothetical protein
MKIQTAFSMLAIALVVAGLSARAGEKANPASSQQFEALKGLMGDWFEVDKDGKTTDKLVSSIRVTSKGSVVQETLFPGSDHEMVTMYHLDGSDLVLTHYCALGNQPRMRAEPGKDPLQIVFKFIGGTNLKSDDDQHMHQATLTLDGKDRLQAEWVSCKDGEACHRVNLDLVRTRK